MSIQAMQIPLIIQLTHLTLASLWNIYGVYLLSTGRPSQGQYASLRNVGVLVVFGILYILCAKYFRILYIVVAAVGLIALIPPIAGTIVKDPSHWTSPVWRWGGGILNSIGVFGALLGIFTIWSLKI